MEPVVDQVMEESVESQKIDNDCSASVAACKEQLPPAVAYRVGIDLGYKQCVVASSTIAAPGAVVVEPNSLANRSTPTIVGFNRGLRTIGETAEGELLSNPSNTVTNLTALLSVENEEDLKAARARWSNDWRFSAMFSSEKASQLVVPVKFGDQRRLMRPQHLLATLIRRLCLTVLDNHHGAVPSELAIGSSTDEEVLDKLSVCVAVPDRLSSEQTDRVLEGAALAGLKHAECIRHSDAIVEQWVARNLPEFYDMNATGLQANGSKDEDMDVGCRSPNPNVYVCLVDIGYAQTSLQICRVFRDEIAGESGDKPKLRVDVASRITDAEIGSTEFENALLTHVKSTIALQHPTFLKNLDSSSKMMSRLSRACEKLMRDLSSLPDSTIDIEAFAEDEDLHLKVTREAYEQACGVHKERLMELLKQCIAEVSAKDPTWKGVAGIDIVGGATRIPWVQQLILKSFGQLLLNSGEATAGDAAERPNGEDSSSGGLLRRSMDGSSAVACGAALWASGLRSREDLWRATLSLDRVIPAIAEQKDMEKEMSIIEILENKRMTMRNSFEAYILKMQAVLNNNKYRDLVDTAKAEKLLRDADNWFTDRPYPDSTLYNEYLDLFEKLERDLAEPFRKYFEKIEAEKKQFEEELSNTAMTAAANGRDEDPDTKLPPSQCLKRALKNKEEGSELLKGGSTEMAAMRYVRALQFLAKLRDASPEQQEEAKTLSVSCNLNVAQCYIKLETDVMLKKAVSCCNAVLHIDSHNMKAMYRKAIALEKMKDYEEAHKEVQMCLAEDPNDADVLRLGERIDKQIKGQEAKTKKMYAKMFS
eukprot:GHVS01074316.1.p1 GENE.GHVS01074316.1~~GHVS01074316.1.p1  ORF type:complete len:819 (+),score=125.87 GHVS01074316.1:153-2609(+)